MKIKRPLPKKIDEFEIIRRIGKGGLGRVYEAEQPSHQRRVALKVLSSKLGLMGQAITRFKHEIETAAALKHPHIVPIYNCGEYGLVTFYSMQLVNGPNLAQVIRGLKFQRAGHPPPRAATGDKLPGDEYLDWALKIVNPVDSKHRTDPAPNSKPSPPTSSQFRKIAEMTAAVADALAYAHRQGVVHRDIKPSNLLLSPDGRLSLTDFGVADMLEQPGMTLSGTLLGTLVPTPTYMSPEQLKAGSGQIDHRTDIYSLGAVLYEWLTLKPPFKAKQRDQLVARIIHKDVKRPREIAKRIPRSLETICLKALEKDPDNRYQTADELAEDLRRFVNQRRIVARRVSFVGRGMRWCAKHRALTASMFLALILAGTAVGFATHLENQRRLASDLEHQINDAFVLSFSGDDEHTLNAIRELESQGPEHPSVEPWIVPTLRGQSALYSGKAADAIVEFKRALELKPGSIEVKTALARALLADPAHIDELNALNGDLARAIAASPRQKMFLGSWISLSDAQHGFEMLEEAHNESTPEMEALARLELTRARWQLVQDTFSDAEADQALLEARLMCLNFDPSSFVHLNEYQVFTIASVVMPTVRRTIEADQFAAEAELKLQRIESRFPTSHAAALAWGWQACFVRDSKQRLEAFQKSVSKCEARHVPVETNLRRAYALQLILSGQLSEAERELESLQAAGATAIEFLLAVLQAESELGVESAQAALSSLPAPYGLDALFRPIGLQILGKTEEARQLYTQMQGTLEFPAYRRDWLFRLVEFGRGAIAAEELIASMDAGRVSHFNRSEGHFFVGMKLLSEGKRLEAKQQFELCVQAAVFTSREFQTARMILEKWKQDPAWPAWIPAAGIDAPR